MTSGQVVSLLIRKGNNGDNFRDPTDHHNTARSVRESSASEVCLSTVRRVAANRVHLDQACRKANLMTIGPRHDGKACKPGQMAPISGIYMVVHVAHRTDHEVIAIRGEQLPPCRVCGADVIFYLTQAVSYVTHDFDLAGLNLTMPRGRAKAAKRSVG